MHDPKFEQEVQQKMHDLEFVPSESVWAGIRQGIAPRKRRRAVAILWWLLPGVLMLAGGIAVYRHSALGRGVAAVAPAAGTGKTADGKAVAGAGVSAGGAATQGAGVSTGGKGTQGAEVSARGAGTQGAEVSAGGGSAAGTASGENVNVGATNEIRTGTITDRGVAGGGEEALAARRASWERYRPGLIGIMISRRGVQAPPLEWQPVKTAVNGISRIRHPWTGGVAAGGGGAWIHTTTGNGHAPLASASALAYTGINRGRGYPQAPAAAGSSFSSGGSKQNQADFKVDYSYWAGVYAEKQVSSRWSVDIGLNLHYYSVKLQTNSPVSAYAPTSASLFTATSFTYALNSTSPASNGGVQTYNNLYYFLEVPATVQWKLNHSHSLPLFWRGGAVLSYLVSSDALYYDNSSGTYKKDNGVARRPQAGVNTGLAVGLPVKGVEIRAGPEIQYALTGMLTTGSGGGHMAYGGIRVSLMR